MWTGKGGRGKLMEGVGVVGAWWGVVGEGVGEGEVRGAPRGFCIEVIYFNINVFSLTRVLFIFLF